MPNILFVTDSAADIPAHLCREHGIRVLPFPVIMDGKELIIGEDFTALEFYAALEAAPEIPTHAQLTPFAFYEVFQQALEAGYTDLIYTSINSTASATYQNAVQARQAFLDEDETHARLNIHIIETRTFTTAYGYAVVEGARRAAQGAAPDEIVEFIKDWVAHVRILFTPFDLRFAKRSGRISAAAAFVGDAMGIKPIMTFENGASKTLAKVRGAKSVIPAMIELCKQRCVPDTPYLLAYGNNKEQADLLFEACRREFGREPVMHNYVGGVIAINAGPNLIGLFFRERDDL